MNQIDKRFANLLQDIRLLKEKELYYRIRSAFESVSMEVKVNMMNFFSQFPYWGKIDLDHHVYEEIELKVKELKEHLKDFEDLYWHLNDYRSKKILYAILNNWVYYDFLSLSQVQEQCFDDYFDLDLIPECKNEVFVDLGAYIGDSTLSFIKNYGIDSYQKIYTYEVTPEAYQLLQKNLEPYPNIIYYLKGVGDHLGKASLLSNEESISANTLLIDEEGDTQITTLDEDIQEKITIIKADIEGFEQQMIKGARQHILKDHPKLLISVYHSNEDLWKIPQMIREIDDSYRFYLRYHGGSIYPTEITLIAI